MTATSSALPSRPTPAREALASVNELNRETVAEYIREHRPLKELLDLSEQVWESMYDFGYKAFQNGQFELAEYWWTHVCLFDSGKDRNWIALGIACQQLNKLQPALNAFSLAVHHGSTNPWAPLHAAECHVQLGNLDKAALALASAEKWAANSPEQDLLLRRAALIRRGLDKQRQESPARS